MVNTRFRKKPLIIDAFQMTVARRLDNRDWPGWLNEAWNLKAGDIGSVYPNHAGTDDGVLCVATSTGEAVVWWGYWIIRGVRGELYCCDPKVFAATYEEVAPEPSRSPTATSAP